MSEEEKPRTFDPAERAREKQAARDADERALATGEKTREDLRRENGFLHGLRFKIDLSGARKRS